MRSEPGAPSLLTSRRRIALGIVGLALASAAFLRLSPADLLPDRAGLEIILRFFGAALSPALSANDPHTGPVSLLPRALAAAWQTLRFATLALSLALLLALPLALLSSRAFWATRREPRRWTRRGARVVIALLRSVHELFYAVLFLAALGLSSAAAIWALALPYAGALAKVFSELLDESDPGASSALAASGASPVWQFAAATVPPALPEMAAYTFYRLECALRSAAVLGFFGIPTLGLRIRQSFENAYYDEVWTWLYSLFALILVAELWSAALRRRLLR